MAAGVRSTRKLAAVGRSPEPKRDGKPERDGVEVECCPNCGYVLRARYDIEPSTARIVCDWFGLKRKETTPAAES
jgi:hypothetical protein